MIDTWTIIRNAGNKMNLKLSRVEDANFALLRIRGINP